jgi:hypothetical protein
MKNLKPIQKEMIRGSWIFSFIPEHERKGKLSDPAVGEQRSETDKRRLCSSTLLQTSEPHRRKLQKFTSKRGTNPEFKRNSASRPSRFPDKESQGAKSTAPQMHREKKHRNEQILHRETNDQNQIFIILLPRKNPKNKNGSVTEIKRSDRDASINHGGTEQIHHITEREREKDMIVLMGLYL